MINWRMRNPTGFLGWLKGGPEEEPELVEAEIIKADEAELNIIDGGDLAILTDGGAKAISKPIASRIVGFADALIPVATAVTDVAVQYGMAIVKFSEGGVTWRDLCVRKSDDWNLLSSFKDGKFNDMAGIKQAALQPIAVANLVMQGTAVAVGAAYMAQISDQLKGVETARREFQLERDVNLPSSFDMPQKYSQRFEDI